MKKTEACASSSPSIVPACAGESRAAASGRWFWVCWLAVASLLVTVSSAGASPLEPALGEDGEWRSKVDSWVLDSAARFGTSEFLLLLEEQADLSGAERLSTKEEKGRYVFERLTETAKRSQGKVLRILADRGLEHRPFWVANMIWVRGDLESIAMLAQRSDVARLHANPRVPLEQPERRGDYRASVTVGLEPNIGHTLARSQFWDNGFSGEGVVIGGQDTGYDWTHPALRASYRGWNGAAASHDYNWHDAIHSGGGVCGPDSLEPCDDGRHGTHTMGIMVGDDGGANRIGMAPGARWIGCRNMDQGVGTPSTYTECFLWFLAPTDLNGRNPDPSQAPDVINNSWTCPPSEGCTDPNALRAVVVNTRAAGILVVVSAGNGGPSCSTVASPISIYGAVLSVGATDNADEYAGFSSRGPVTVDGSNRIKPDIAAPGVGVRSSVTGGGFDSFNGTSMAAPHVAGMAALTLSAAPCLRGKPKKLEKHLLRTALPRSGGALCFEASESQIPNNTYGHGVLRGVLPGCPRDGRIAASVDLVDARRVVCRNRSSGKKVSIRLNGMRAWNCMAKGLAAESGDRVLLRVTGKAPESGAVTGSVSGVDTEGVVCKNRTTGQKVKLPLDGADSWNCEAAGLVVTAGDRIKQTLTGWAQADS
jgi:subtilisin family serine protease